MPALASAFYLQRRQERVLVVDDANPSASRAGAGILSPLPPWKCAPPLQELAARGAAMYPDLLAELGGGSCGYCQPGMVVLPPFDEAALAQWRGSGGAAAEMKDASVLSALLPRGRALHLPQVAALQSRQLVKALRRRCPRRVGTVARLEVRRGKVARVRLADGSALAAGKVLLSAGAWSGGLCPPPAVDIRPLRGQLLLYDNPGVKLPAVLLREEDSSYLVQRPDGRILAGSTVEQAGFDSRPTRAGMAGLGQRAAALLPLLANRAPRAAWAGLRPAADMPVIARHAAVENLYLNSGHFRYGVTMAPAAAAHLLRVADGDVAEADNPYRHRAVAGAAAPSEGGSGRT